MYYERQTTLVVASIPRSSRPDRSGLADHGLAITYKSPDHSFQCAAEPVVGAAGVFAGEVGAMSGPSVRFAGGSVGLAAGTTFGAGGGTTFGAALGIAGGVAPGAGIPGAGFAPPAGAIAGGDDAALPSGGIAP